MAAKPLPAQSTLLKYLDYSMGTGRFYWRERSVADFSKGGIGAENSCRIWNDRYAGKEAWACGNPKGSRGYVQANFLGKKYLKHRIAWKYVTGEEPDEVDHINGDRTDNRFANLRSVTRAENSKNAAIFGHNTSGCTGVFWNKQCRRWHATIHLKGKTRHLGVFLSKDDAIRARKAGEREMGFHPNHGRRNGP